MSQGAGRAIGTAGPRRGGATAITRKGGLGAGFTDTTAFGIAVGLSYAVTFGLTAALAAGHHHAWMAYVIATARFAAAGQLPRGTMLFLDDAHRLGLLSTVGPLYQFRHAEFQDHLAGPAA
jgi:hypothetical protein